MSGRGFASAEATRGLSDRPLDPFGSHPCFLNCIETTHRYCTFIFPKSRHKSTAIIPNHIPQKQKIAIGQAIRSRWHFHYALTFPKLSGISTIKCGWHDKSPADTRSSGSSSAFSGYRRRKSVTGAIGHDAFASVL